MTGHDEWIKAGLGFCLLLYNDLYAGSTSECLEWIMYHKTEEDMFRSCVRSVYGNTSIEDGLSQ